MTESQGENGWISPTPPEFDLAHSTGGPVPPPPDPSGPPVRGAVREEVPEVPGLRLTRRLGRGGMGVVYAATQTALGREVAVKFVHAPAHPREESLARFQAEARLVARLQHPNIVQLFEVGECAGQPFLILELVPGGSLAEALRAGPLPAAPAAELVSAIAGAVEAAHAAGVIHRDLKPANILLSAECGARSAELKPGLHSALRAPHSAFLPKVSDFGLAKVLGTGEGSDLTHAGVILGTPSYMAPEQAGGTGVGPAADVYALGAILYETLTGRPPFRAATALETLDLVRSAEPLPPRQLQPAIPRDLETICLKCLRKEPDRRYRSARELAEDLRRFLDGRPIQARPVGAIERATKLARRNPAVAALLVLAFLIPIGAVVGAAVHNARLQHALDQKRIEEEKAVAERDRADANYRHAREALRRTLDQLTDPRYADLPRVKELRNAQAAQALSFYRSVAALRDDPSAGVRYDAARAELEAAKLCVVVSRIDEAIDHAARSRDGFTRLVSEFPADRAYRFGRADATGTLAQVRGDKGEPFDNTVALYSEAIADLESLVVDPEAPDGVAEVLANATNTLGCVYHVAGRHAEAEPYLRAAYGQRLRLAADRPREREITRQLTENALNLSAVYRALKWTAEADDFHARAEATLEKLVAEDPTDSLAVCRLAVLRSNVAFTMLSRGKGPEAIDRLSAMLPLLEASLRKEPADRAVRDALFRVHGTRGQLHELAGRWPEALADSEKVVEYAAPEAKRFHRWFVNRTRLQTGDLKGSLTEAEELYRTTTAKVPSGETCFAASTCAMLADRLRAAGPADVDRAERLAVAFLERAKESAGPVEWAKLCPGVIADPSFRSLHGRANFRAVMGK